MIGGAPWWAWLAPAAQVVAVVALLVGAVGMHRAARRLRAENDRRDER